MAGVLSLIANPKERSEVTATTFDCLNRETALILFAVAEAVLGEGFLVKAPQFVETVDDYLNYQRPAQREQFRLALLITETTLPLTVGGMTTHFSHLSMADRRKILERLRSSSQEQRRNIYAALVNVSASTYYASELTWIDLDYKGVSVDHPEILTQPPPIPWRPDDPRPIED
ncbi:MAG TPA: hypothetical protein VFY60_09265 [Pyrinomonadaceae bacterium]|nr:hypothetical protein [Pyrinomonadaceae bacterium]